MTSTSYKSIVLLYQNDDGSNSLRQIEYEIDPATGKTYVPLTPLVSTRIVPVSSKFEGMNVNLRSLIIVVDQREFKAVIPYSPKTNQTLKACIREILDSSRVITGKYQGELQSYGDTANNNI